MSDNAKYPGRPTEVRRDELLDAMRGIAMLCIAISHVGMMADKLGFTGWNILTLTDVSYSTVAELFIFLSGYMSGLVYLGRPDGTNRLLQRVIRLYLYNFIAFLSVIAVAVVFGEPLSSATGVTFTAANPLVGVAVFAVLGQQPFLLDVLPLYIVLLLTAPVFTLLLRKNMALAVALSLLLYLMAQVFPTAPRAAVARGFAAIGLEDPWIGQFLRAFNPFAWQFIFFAAMMAGRRKVHLLLAGILRSNPMFPLAIIGIFVLIAVTRFFTVETADLFRSRVALRFPHILGLASVLLMLQSVLILLQARDSQPFRFLLSILQVIGKSTLLCFTVSIPVTYLIGGLWTAIGLSQGTYVLGVAATLITVMVVAKSGSGAVYRRGN